MSAADKIKFAFLSKKKTKPRQKPVLKSLERYAEVLLFATTHESELMDLAAKTFPNAKISIAHPRDKTAEDGTKTDYTYHVSDLNLTGQLKNDKLKELLQIQFDLVIDLCPEGQISFFLLNQMNQSFMIGRKDMNRSHLYNLILPATINNKEAIELISQQITLLSQNGTK